MTSSTTDCTDWVCPVPGCGVEWCHDRDHDDRWCARCEVEWHDHAGPSNPTIRTGRAADTDKHLFYVKR